MSFHTIYEQYEVTRNDIIATIAFRFEVVQINYRLRCLSPHFRNFKHSSE
jgi:hypothetical protein